VLFLKPIILPMNRSPLLFTILGMSLGALGTVWTVLNGLSLVPLLAMGAGFVLSLLAVLRLGKASEK